MRRYSVHRSVSVYQAAPAGTAQQGTAKPSLQPGAMVDTALQIALWVA